MKDRRRRSCEILAWVWLSSFNAGAQPMSGDKTVAAQLAQEADRLMSAGNVAAACPKYDESQRRDPQLGTLLQLADCQEKLGKTASAWASYKAAAEIAARGNAAGATDSRAQIAGTRAAALEPNLSRLTIIVTQTDAASLEVRQDGELFGRAAWGLAWPVDPGKYTISAQAKGKKPFVKTVEITAGGAKIEVTIPPLEDGDATATAIGPAAPVPPGPVAAAPAPAIMAPPPIAPERNTKGDGQRLLGYVAGGVGILSVGAGVAFGIRSNSLESERDAICPSGVRCTPTEAQFISHVNDVARANAIACNVALVFGGAAILGGVALVLTAPSARSGASATAPALRIGPWGAPNSAGASLQGRW